MNFNKLSSFWKRGKAGESASQGATNVDASRVLSEMPSFEEHMATVNGEKNVTPEKVENFKKLVDFLKRDAAVKQTLARLAPNEAESYGDNAVKYADKLYDGLQDISFDLNSIMRNFYTSEAIGERLKQIKGDVIGAGVDFERLTQVYKKDFAAMSEDFNNGVHNEAFGYGYGDPHVMDKKATSVNEMLHLMHCAIVDTGRFKEGLPVLATDKKGEVNLFGPEAGANPVAEGIFDGMKDGGYITDIVALPEQVLMMVRDRGHALTVDVKKDADGQTFVNYFVPKICNVDKVNQLPGVQKIQKKEGVNQVLDFTTGVFRVDKGADVAKTVLDFVEAVPTDDDIERTW